MKMAKKNASKKKNEGRKQIEQQKMTATQHVKGLGGCRQNKQLQWSCARDCPVKAAKQLVAGGHVKMPTVVRMPGPKLIARRTGVSGTSSISVGLY